MKALSFVLNIVLLIVCGTLFLQNRALRAELSLDRMSDLMLDEEADSLALDGKPSLKKARRAAKAEKKALRKKKGPAAARLDVASDDMSEEVFEEAIEERVQELLEERVEEEVGREMERHHQERMAHREERMEQAQSRMTEALYEHLEAVEWDAEVAEQVEELILGDLELHRDVHAQVLSGELEHFEARAQIHEQRRAHQEELSELIGPDQTHELLMNLQEARHSGKGERERTP